MEKINLEQIGRLLRYKNTVVFGEVHGSKNNIFFLKKLVSFLIKEKIKFLLCFEWQLDKSKLCSLNDYLIGSKDVFTLSDFFFRRDGRFSFEHLDFLKWLRTLNLKLNRNSRINIFAFDTKGKDWTERDRKMANKLSKIKFNGMKIVFTGNLHARKKPFKINSSVHKPMASFLSKSRVLSVFLCLAGGNIYNFGSKKVKDLSSLKKKNCLN